MSNGLKACPTIEIILANAIVVRIGIRVGAVGDLPMLNWEEEHAVKVRRSMSTFVRSHTTPASAVAAWRLNYSPLEQLFVEIIGFGAYVEVIAEFVLRHSKSEVVLRVGSGAFLLTLDRFTDIYVISTYYGSDDLIAKANVLLAMISICMFCQLLAGISQYQKKSVAVKVWEALITLFFMRPAVDAFRVATNHEDDEATMDPLSQMFANKGCQLGFESIPGCVLQIYVWLIDPEEAGTFALLSIVISAMTTGFTSAMIAYDMDVDMPHRLRGSTATFRTATVQGVGASR